MQSILQLLVNESRKVHFSIIILHVQNTYM
jgi:hypothetical protein